MKKEEVGDNDNDDGHDDEENSNGMVMTTADVSSCSRLKALEMKRLMKEMKLRMRTKYME